MPLDFASFKSSFKGDIYTPTDTDYTEALVRWAKNAQINAQVVAFVKDPQDVAIAIAFARDNNLAIAIRGGGHSTAGASSSEGLVIDLSRHIKNVEVDVEKKLAYVGGGATWGDVDKATIQHGLATVAGTVNHTGVGGLTLGGGVGWLCGAHGLVIDNLVQVTVVNSKGLVLTANDTENPELFFGIKGGGCNFGVVTQFVFKLYPQRRTVFAGPVIYTAEVLDQLVDVTNAWRETATDKEAMFIALSKSPHGPGPALVVILFYNGSEAEGRENFKAFFNIKHIVDRSSEVPYEELNALQNPMVGYGQARLIKGAYHIKSDLPSMKQVLERVVALSTEEHNPVVIFENFPLKKILSVPNGTSAFVRSGVNNVISITTWTNNTTENLEKARAIAHELTDIVAAGQKAHFAVNRGYGNYDQDGTEELSGVANDKARVLFAGNYPRLQKLKQVHDPENIFSKWFPITPAV